MYGIPAIQRVNFTAQELKNHFSAIGAEVNVVKAEVINEIGPTYAMDAELDETPGEEEIWLNMCMMKEGAPGPDTVTARMISKGGEVSRLKTTQMVQKLWNQDPDEWEEIVHEAEVIALPKKGDLTKLDNYRGICLLQIISRLIARIMAKRLTKKQCPPLLCTGNLTKNVVFEMIRSHKPLFSNLSSKFNENRRH